MKIEKSTEVRIHPTAKIQREPVYVRRTCKNSGMLAEKKKICFWCEPVNSCTHKLR